MVTEVLPWHDALGDIRPDSPRGRLHGPGEALCARPAQRTARYEGGLSAVPSWAGSVKVIGCLQCDARDISDQEESGNIRAQTLKPACSIYKNKLRGALSLQRFP